MKPIVFAGPSIHGLKCDYDVDFAPPATCGDLMRAANSGRRVIGLIDGVFESGPAVWHKEVLFAIASGCVVVGASSMGALRAAECWGHGMIGLGRIFDDYRSGRRTADADVALVHGPSDFNYIPLSVPLVDVDDAVGRARQSGILDALQTTAIMVAARHLHFKERSWAEVLGYSGIDTGKAVALISWIDANGPGAKTRDAAQLLGYVNGLDHRTKELGIARRCFVHTEFSHRLLEQVSY